MGICCACWNDDWGCCSVSAVGIYHQMREAATDAAVEVIGAYKEKDVTQRTVPVISTVTARWDDACRKSEAEMIGEDFERMMRTNFNRFSGDEI
jgi:hypothetical protein